MRGVFSMPRGLYSGAGIPDAMKQWAECAFVGESGRCFVWIDTADCSHVLATLAAYSGACLWDGYALIRRMSACAVVLCTCRLSSQGPGVACKYCTPAAQLAPSPVIPCDGMEK